MGASCSMYCCLRWELVVRCTVVIRWELIVISTVVFRWELVSTTAVDMMCVPISLT